MGFGTFVHHNGKYVINLPQWRFWQRRAVPLILQTETAECGLACLCMVASYWGHRIDLAGIRQRFSVSLKGTTLKSLMLMSQGLHLQTRPLKLDLDHLAELRLPCILHWDLNHFVVLKSTNSNRAAILDPAFGERNLSLAELAKHFTGVALELTPSAEFKKAEERQVFTLMSLMGRVIGFKRSILQMLLLGLALQVCTLIVPFYMQWVVDEALVAADRNLVTTLGIGFLLLVLIQTTISAVRSWITTVMATNLNFQWLGNTFAHLMKLPLTYFEKRHTGDIVSRFGSIQSIQHSLTTEFVEGVIDGVLVAGTLIIMLLYSPLLTLVASAAVFLYGLLRWSVFKVLREASAEQIMHSAKQQTHFMESVRGVQSLRLFNRTDDRRASWTNILADQFNAELRIARLSLSYQTANSLLFSSERVIVIWMAALAVLDTRFSVGMLFAFISYKDQFSGRLASLIDKLFDLFMLRLHGERLADIVLTKPEEESTKIDVEREFVSPSVELRNLGFQYADSEPFILRNVSLSIPAGQCVAITGPSGCGKTTLMKLILGVLEPTEGEIFIGGVPLKHLGKNDYRSLLGIVLQDDNLFAGSIADNITFFDPMPDQHKMEACAQLAAIHAEIAGMPMGFHTLVGDIGSGLSGGQKQRILLARALYKNPKLLVLDEATSHLDVWNEQAVNIAIQKLDLTRIIVAHRPETIAMAQRVIVLQGGSVMQDVRNK